MSSECADRADGDMRLNPPTTVVESDSSRALPPGATDEATTTAMAAQANSDRTDWGMSDLQVPLNSVTSTHRRVRPFTFALTVRRKSNRTNPKPVDDASVTTTSDGNWSGGRDKRMAYSARTGRDIPGTTRRR